MLCFGLILPLIQMIQHTTWEFFMYQMVEIGHRAHTALKAMLYRKNFRMTSATNKDFSPTEICTIVMDESDRVWDFIW